MENGCYYRIAVNLADGSSLRAREFFNPEERHYSFHWQTAAGELILRWDDAPHHRDLATFPYHLHDGSLIRTSLPVSLREVLAEIEKQIATKGWQQCPRLRSPGARPPPAVVIGAPADDGLADERHEAGRLPARPCHSVAETASCGSL